MEMNGSANELSPDLLGVASLNPGDQHDSSSRKQMFHTHLGQALHVKDCTPRRLQTGMEREYGRYTFNITMPCDASIIRILDKYPQTYGTGGINENPMTVVVYEDIDTKTVGVLELTRFHSIHQNFGYRYNYRPITSKLYPGAHIAKDTVIAASPSITEEGDYMYGAETEVAFMSLPAVIEDGVIASESYVRRLTTKAYGNRIVQWGKEFYPLNLYGDDDNYKPFPDIGETIRADGLLFALRPYDPLLGPVEMSRSGTQEPDYIYDRLTYAEPEARVVDVIVHHDPGGRGQTPVGMEAQPAKYSRASNTFYAALVDEWRRMRRQRKEHLKITPAFQRLLVEALADTAESGGQRVVRRHKMQPLDEWRVEIVLEYDLVPTIGFKLTDAHGGKGVICDIMKDEDMPVDSQGNRAELIMDGHSTIKRMNIGRMYEQYYNACGRSVSAGIRRMFGFGFHDVLSDKDIKLAVTDNPDVVKEAYERLLDFYHTVSPPMYQAIREVEDGEYIPDHVGNVLRDGIYLWVPTNNPKPSPDIVKDLRKKYPPVHGPVTYRGRSGQVVTTTDKILIGSMYILLLDKTGGSWQGVASSKLQHFGIPARLTNLDKYSEPGRMQPVRIMGESEVRLFVATIGPEATADIIDQSNNPRVHKAITSNILQAPTPTNMERIIDRTKYPMGSGRPVVFVRHVLECGGVEFVND